MKKMKKNKKEKKEISPSAFNEPPVVSSTANDTTVPKNKAKKDKNNKTKQFTKQNTNESLPSNENHKEADDLKECPFQAVFETFTASKPKKQRKAKKISKDESSEEVSTQAEMKVDDVDVKPKDNKEKRSKSEKKKSAKNGSIEDKSQV